jgi:hypothetical protein
MGVGGIINSQGGIELQPRFGCKRIASRGLQGVFRSSPATLVVYVVVSESATF